MPPIPLSLVLDTVIARIECLATAKDGRVQWGSWYNRKYAELPVRRIMKNNKIALQNFTEANQPTRSYRLSDVIPNVVKYIGVGKFHNLSASDSVECPKCKLCVVRCFTICFGCGSAVCYEGERGLFVPNQDEKILPLLRGVALSVDQTNAAPAAAAIPIEIESDEVPNPKTPFGEGTGLESSYEKMNDYLFLPTREELLNMIENADTANIQGYDEDTQLVLTQILSLVMSAALSKRDLLALFKDPEAWGSVKIIQCVKRKQRV